MSFIKKLLGIHETKVQAPMKRVSPRHRNYKWTPGENKNPQVLSLLKAGHSFTYSKRYLVSGDNEKDTIVLVDLDNMSSEIVFNGINHLSLSRTFSEIKNIQKCTSK